MLVWRPQRAVVKDTTVTAMTIISSLNCADIVPKRNCANIVPKRNCADIVPKRDCADIVPKRDCADIVAGNVKLVSEKRTIVSLFRKENLCVPV